VIERHKPGDEFLASANRSLTIAIRSFRKNLRTASEAVKGLQKGGRPLPSIDRPRGLDLLPVIDDIPTAQDSPWPRSQIGSLSMTTLPRPNRMESRILGRVLTFFPLDRPISSEANCLKVRSPILRRPKEKPEREKPKNRSRKHRELSRLSKVNDGSDEQNFKHQDSRADLYSVWILAAAGTDGARCFSPTAMAWRPAAVDQEKTR